MRRTGCIGLHESGFTLGYLLPNRQETPHCASVSFERHAANAFQGYVRDALAFSIKRGGLLYGSVSEDKKVTVEAIYEPPQVGACPHPEPTPMQAGSEVHALQQIPTRKSQVGSQTRIASVQAPKEESNYYDGCLTCYSIRLPRRRALSDLHQCPAVGWLPVIRAACAAGMAGGECGCAAAGEGHVRGAASRLHCREAGVRIAWILAGRLWV